jgi:hypothetical protein
VARLPTAGELIADLAEAFPGQDLDRLTLGRFLMLREQAARVRRRRAFERAGAARHAYWDDPQEWRKFVEDLTDE